MVSVQKYGQFVLNIHNNLIEIDCINFNINNFMSDSSSIDNSSLVNQHSYGRNFHTNSRVNIQETNLQQTESPNNEQISVRKKAGFIMSKKRSVSQINDPYSSSNIEPTGLNIKVNTQFNPNRKPPVPKINRKRNNPLSISVDNPKFYNRYDTVSFNQPKRGLLMRQLNEEEYPYGKNTKGRAQSKIKKRIKDTLHRPIGEQKVNEQKSDKNFLQKELQSLMDKKQKMQSLYSRKNYLRQKLQKLNKDLNEIKYKQIAIDKGYDLKVKKLMNSKEKVKRSQKRSKTELSEQKEGNNKSEEKQGKNKREQNDQNTQQRNKDEESQIEEFYEHRDLQHKCLECRHFQLKKDDIHIPYDVKKQYLS